MKQILVPTDLSVKSLSVIHEMVERYQPERINIHLVHMVQIPSDISELMFSRKRNLYEAVPAEFVEAMQLLKNKYALEITTLKLEFYYGNYAGALQAIIENLKIDNIYILNDEKYALPFKNSVNILPFLSSCKVPVHKIKTKGNLIATDDVHLLSSLFVDEKSRLQMKEKESSSLY